MADSPLPARRYDEDEVRRILERATELQRVLEIQRTTGTHGQPSVLGRTLTWQADTPAHSRSLQVTVASREGETRIRIEERLHKYAGGLFGGLMGGVGGGVGLFCTPFPGNGS